MAITFYGDYLRTVREQAGLSLEKLADGICNLQSLCRVENNRAGISPGTFQALTSKCGASTEVFPLFVDWDDYECFYEMCKVDMWLQSWQVEEAYHCLQKIENRKFSGNKIYYQKWLYCHAHLQMRAGAERYDEIYEILCHALKITKSRLDLEDFKEEFFTVTEIRIMTEIAELAFFKHNDRLGLSICSQLMTYLDSMVISYMEKNRLWIGIRKVYILYLIQNKEMEYAKTLAEELRKAVLVQNVEEYMIEVTFLYGLTKYLCGDKEQGIHFLRGAYFSGDAIQSHFARKGNGILLRLGLDRIPELEEAMEYCPPKVEYQLPDIHIPVETRDVECDYYSPDVITYGKIIRRKRKEQRVSMQKICQGLCSVSALSKIENDTLQPDIFLARALMQRLGMSDEPFTFYASERETKQYVLERKFVGIERYKSEEIPDLLSEMKQLITKKDRIFEQYYMDLAIYYNKDIAIYNPLLLDNIKKTLPAFDMKNITDYKLSRNELAFLIGYCNKVRNEKSDIQAIKDFYHLFDYMQQDFLDELYKSGPSSLVMAALVNLLGMQDRNNEILELEPFIHDKINYTNTYKLPTMYAQLSTIYSSDTEKYPFKEYALYTYYLFVIHDSHFASFFAENMRRRVGYEVLTGLS